MTETHHEQSITVLGAGSWGTALAIQFARAGQDTVLWGRAEDEPELLAKQRRNERYLPGIEFPGKLSIEADLETAVRTHRDILIAVPSHAFRVVCSEIAGMLSGSSRIAWATKGFEQETGKLPHEVAREVLGEDRPLAVLSGPTFAREVGEGLPSAMSVAATDPEFTNELATRISTETFRAYTNNDPIGVEVGGATKNVIAIAAGISDGLGYGANTRVAIICRGLYELMKLGESLGARPQTFMGLSGMGDLVLTCTDDQSRNRRMGLGLAKGGSVDEIAAEIGQVVEGVYAAKSVRIVAQRNAVEMPICEEVYRILYEGSTPAEAARELMARPIIPEA
jgi:glycerol-3-phosphate dehydrogenase (NAD(P)+)